jgi:TorA maturation chaperone TorD
MTPSQHALARSRAYDLFGHLYLRGVTEDVRSAVAEIGDLADALPSRADADEAAAVHYRLFGFNVPPYASLFLDEEARLAGPVAGRVRRWYEQVGFSASTSGEEPDHLGVELRFLALLSGAEADAWRDDRSEDVDDLRRLQRHLLDGHLLWWLPGLIHVVQQQGPPFYARLATLTLDLILDHRAALGERAATERPPLPPPDLDLDDARTSLKDIARFLTVPARCGLYLSRDAITHLGRQDDLPRGFGGRMQMLLNLLRSAAEFGRMEALIDRLSDKVEAWRAVYQQLQDTDVPGTAPVAEAWKQQLAATQRVLHRMRTAMPAGGDEG